MRSRWRTGIAFGTLAAGWILPARTPEADSNLLRITVYDAAHAPREVMQRVFASLCAILHEAGITAQMTEGDLEADEASRFTYVSLPGTGAESEASCHARRDIALKIIALSPPGVHETVLGMSSPFADGGLNVRMFNDHVVEAASRHRRPYAAVLACAIAHEIGHVLLRSGSHEMHGLMSGVWTEHEYAHMGSDALLFFTGEEAGAMLANLRGAGCASQRSAPNRPQILQKNVQRHAKMPFTTSPATPVNRASWP